MKNLVSRRVSVAALFLLLSFSTALAGPRVVNCDNGDSLEEAILSGLGSAKELQITLMGTCYESFVISRDRVVIEGDGNPIIHGQIQIFDSDSVALSGITISGPGHGIDVLNSRVRLVGSHLVDNERFGIRARFGAVVTMRDGTISGNQGTFGAYAENAALQLVRTDVSDNAETGIGLQDNSRLRMSNGSVTDHHYGSGIVAFMGSALLFEGTTVARNADVGLHIDSGSNARIDDSDVTDNSNQGVQVQGNSFLVFAGGTAARNGENGIFASSHAVVEIHDATIQNNYGNGVLATTDSGIFVRGMSFLSFNNNWDLLCVGEESSAEVDIAWPGETGSVQCSGF